MFISMTQKSTLVRRLSPLVQRYKAIVDALRNTTPGMVRGYLRAILLDLGWLGVVGIGIITMCMAFYFSALRPTQERLQMLRESVTQVGKKGGRQQGIVEGGLAPEEQLAIFYGSFPLRASIPLSLGKIYTVAAIEGLTLEQADYKASRPNAGKMTRYQLNLPIKGEYAKLHKFLVRVLMEVPNASLEKVLFERKSIGDPIVNATVSLVLHLGPEP